MARTAIKPVTFTRHEGIVAITGVFLVSDNANPERFSETLTMDAQRFNLSAPDVTEAAAKQEVAEYVEQRLDAIETNLSSRVSSHANALAQEAALKGGNAVSLTAAQAANLVTGTT